MFATEKDLDKEKAENSALETLITIPEEFEQLSSSLSESVKKVLQQENKQLVCSQVCVCVIFMCSVCV